MLLISWPQGTAITTKTKGATKPSSIRSVHNSQDRLSRSNGGRSHDGAGPDLLEVFEDGVHDAMVIAGSAGVKGILLRSWVLASSLHL